MQKDLPGLYKELEGHFSSMGMDGECLNEMPKASYRRRVKDYVERKNKEELLLDLRRYKKLKYDEIESAPFVRKAYFADQNLEDARILFRASSRIIPTIKACYPSKYRRQGIPLTCPSCTPASSIAASQSSSTTESREGVSPPLHSLTHILEDCELVSDLRANCTVSDDHSLAD